MSVCLFVCAELLRKAVESVLADESFKLPSPLAADALSTAQKLAASINIIWHKPTANLKVG